MTTPSFAAFHIGASFSALSLAVIAALGWPALPAHAASDNARNALQPYAGNRILVQPRAGLSAPQ